MITGLRELIVHGVPTPQGSKTRMPNGAMVEAGTSQSRQAKADWRNDVARASALNALEHGYVDWPEIAVQVVFRFRMPASRPASVRADGWAYKATAPDLDKLLRSIGDSLQSTLIVNDARIVAWQATKIEVADGWTGAAITLAPASHARRPAVADDMPSLL